MTDDRSTAPKADALPGCATPRTSAALSAPEGNSATQTDLSGSEWQNAAGTGAESPGIVPEPRSSDVPLPGGLSKREWFAGKALAGMAGHFSDPEKVARACFAMADAMIDVGEAQP